MARVRWKRVGIRVGWAALAVGIAGVVTAWLVLRTVEQGLPDVHELRSTYRPPQVTRILARDGSLLAELFTERRTVVAIGSLPAHVKLAVLAAEDAGFYEHKGLNYFGLLRAFLVNARAGRTRQGGSTITQQVVKNILLDPERTYRRKLKEVVLARRLEQDLSKDEILELYLNHIYFGGGRYGIEEAARYYFGKHASELTIGEAALLGALLASPELFSPRNDLPRCLTRRGFVLDQMEKKGFLPTAMAKAARDEPVHLAPTVEAQGTLAPEVVDVVRKTLKEVVGESGIRGGYTVHTTIDLAMQGLARKAVRDNLVALDKRTGVQGPIKRLTTTVSKRKGGATASDRPFEGMPKANEIYKSLVGVVTETHDDAGTLDVQVGNVPGVVKLADFERYNPQHLSPSAFAEVGALLRVSFFGPLPQGTGTTPERPEAVTVRVPLRLEQGAQSALVALDVRSREIRALIGSYEGTAGGLDRAMQARRQPGSTFKPILYSYAIHSRQFTAASLIDAAGSTQSIYKNVNHEDGTATEPLRLREGLARSVNAVALHVMRTVGPEHVVPWAQALGFGSKLGADLSLALGAYEVIPLEMAGAYATFAGGGMYEPPRLITKILGPDGQPRELRPLAEPRRVLEENESYLVTSLLTSVVDHGTGARAKDVGRPVAGKTGTTNQAKDAWFVGYSTDIVCAVWTGYDDPRPLGGGREAGATAALPAWVAFMKNAHEKGRLTEFPRPPGLVVVRIDPASGLRAYEGQMDAIEELFLPGTEPAETATPGGNNLGNNPGIGNVPMPDLANAGPVPAGSAKSTTDTLPALPAAP